MDVKLLQDIPPWDWPRGTAELLHKTLLDRRADSEDRLIAAELAGELVVLNDELASDLLAILEDSGEPPELRARAAIALGPVLEQVDDDGFDDPGDLPIREETVEKIQESLQAVYEDAEAPKEVRRRVLEGSVRCPQDWHTEAIRTAYSTGDREWVLTAVFAMAYVPGFEKQVLEQLKSGDPEIHQEAVNTAGQRGIDGAWPHLVKIVKEPGTAKPLLLAAIGAMGAIRPREALSLLDPLVDSDDEEIAEAVGDILSMVAGEDDGGWVN